MLFLSFFHLFCASAIYVFMFLFIWMIIRKNNAINLMNKFHPLPEKLYGNVEEKIPRRQQTAQKWKWE
jgi:hypothetical protein